MDEPTLPGSAERLKEQLVDLRKARRQRQANRRIVPVRRKSLTVTERASVLKKTDGRCHICGGEVASRWEADHVLAHNTGGLHSAENYLPAHTLCNNYRWDYDPEEFQWVLKIGVWARFRMEGKSPLGKGMVEVFFKKEAVRQSRCRSEKLNALNPNNKST